MQGRDAGMEGFYSPNGSILQKGPNADLPQCGGFKSRLGILFCMTLLRALLDNSLPVLGVISDFSVWHKENL